MDENLLQRTLKALQSAKSDTDIFSALMLVTKAVKAENADRETCVKIYQAVGFDFLEKMLKTKDADDGCPSYMYQSVAYTILASFCMEEEFALNPKMLAFVDNFKAVLLSNPTDTDEQFMVSDVLQCLKLISDYEDGRKNLLENGIFECMSQIILEKYFNHEDVFPLFLKFTKYDSNTIWNNNMDLICNVLEQISKEFHDDDSEKKFESCTHLYEILVTFPSSASICNDLYKKEWTSMVHKGLSNILKSRISKEQRDPALLLLSVMLECFGTQWLIQNADEADKKFVTVVLHLMCIEVRVTLETLSIEEVVKESVLITSCYSVLEKLIMALTSGDCILGLDSKKTLQFVSAMTETFKAVMKFLRKVYDLWECSKKNGDSEKFGENLVMASFRVLCSWLSEETAAARDEINEVLPFLFELAKDHLNLKQCSDSEGDIDIMRFFLAPLCHLSAEDSSRVIMVEHKFYQVIATYLDSIWKKFVKSSFKSDELEAALSTICGIFMNIVVLERDLIPQDKIFHDIFLFVFSSLPQLNNKRDHLVLRANLAVFGLLLMKHFISKVNTNEMIMYKYISATLKFLWDAHHIDEQGDYVSFLVNIDYRCVWEDISELWFLGMQALTSLLKAVPWICDFILESGWTQELMDSFSKVTPGAMELNVKYTYENFLCHLIKCESNGERVAEALKEKGALAICEAQEMLELQKVLK